MQNGGVWVGGALFLFGLVIFDQSFSYAYYSDVGPGPGFFPLWLSGILMVLSVLYIVFSIKTKKEKISFRETFSQQKKELAKVAEILLSLIIFIVLAPYTGFNIAGIAMLFVLLIRSYRWHSALGISVIVTLSVFVLFHRLLEIPLPVNSFGW